VFPGVKVRVIGCPVPAPEIEIIARGEQPGPSHRRRGALEDDSKGIGFPFRPGNGLSTSRNDDTWLVIVDDGERSNRGGTQDHCRIPARGPVELVDQASCRSVRCPRQ